MTPDELRAALASFTGTNDWHKHLSGLLYTDGVKFLADNAGAYWFIDLIASHQKRARRDRKLREFQIWKLVRSGNAFDAICYRDHEDEAFRQRRVAFDFPLDEVKVYLENEVLCLPSER